ncbi:LCP family protein [Streptomyces telluris]|uniref:LCP family protein n=1 Tax=Streptomyces telluris TaxID=2720021 RepID=A0A9X2LKB7_9ACTN|nr:LCP family protein [Streptomyces telluris]MCQ8772758.1 LCP family protein [Streptomyces telluris]NJP78413.1 LCP family protein [Streptomyces telluris]
MTAPAPSPHPRRARHGAPRRPRWGLRLATCAAVAVLAAGGIGHAVVTDIDSRIGRVDPFAGLSDRPPVAVSKGMNILLVGTDARDRIDPEERQRYHLGGTACHCTDTVMLLHLSAARDRVSVVSLPRDTYAEIPAHVDEAGRPRPAHAQKLNAAYAEGGPGLTVRTVELLTGVHVDHYLEVDFTSFMRTVDVVGGVQVCSARPLRDPYSGLDLPPGTSTLNGGQALQYVRSRHLDGASDLGRMERQQRFLASLLHTATDGGALLNPVKFQQVAATLLGSVRADRGFDGETLIGLGRAMKNLSPASAEFASVPVGSADYPVPRVGSTVKWDDEAAARLFEALREDRPLTARSQRQAHDAKPPPPPRPAPSPAEAAPGQVRVQVYNGSGRRGLARETDRALRAGGFATTGLPADAPGPPVRRTVIQYDPRWDHAVRTLASALPDAELRPVPGQGPLMKVTVGTDFRAVTPVKPQPSPSPRSPQAPRRGTGPNQRAVSGDQVLCPEKSLV